MSILQFPLMFLSGIFFPLETMPGFLRGVATLMPLTYLGDADGVVRRVFTGALTRERLEAALQPIVPASCPGT